MTKRRQDAEDRWLEARERGESAAPIPEETAAKYAKLRSLLDDLPVLPAGVKPRRGWQGSVFDAIDRGETELAPSEAVPQVRSIETAPRVRSSKQRAVVVAACVAAAAGIVVVVKLATTTPAAAPELTIVAVATAGAAHRAPEVLVAGETAIVRGAIDGPGELRAYGADDAELGRCSATGPGCTVDRSDERTTLQLELVLPPPGALHLVLLAAPLRGPSGGRARDLADAERAGIAVTPLDKIVR
jgi:hypothetical protein